MRAFLHPANPGYSSSHSQISRKSGLPLQAASTIRQLRSQISASSPNVGNVIHNEAIAKTFQFDTELSAMGGIEYFYRVECRSNVGEFQRKLSRNFDVVVFSYANIIAPPVHGKEESQRKQFRILSEIVRSINVPLLVFGIGMQNRLSSQDDILPELLEFMRELNAKAEVFGCRGAETEKFLKVIGCDRAQALGCPSLYVFPSRIKSIRDISDFRKKRGITAGYLDRKHLLRHREERIRLLEKISSELDLSYVFQNDLLTLAELEDTPSLFSDSDNSCDETIVNSYINSFGYKIDIQEYLFFRDPRSWRQYASSRDYFFGDRFHGGVATLQTGRPALFIYNDIRVLELTHHFGLPSVSLNDVMDGDVNDVLEKNLGKDSIQRMQDCYTDRLREYMKTVTQAGLTPLSGLYEKPGKRPVGQLVHIARIRSICEELPRSEKIIAAMKLAVLNEWSLAGVERLINILLSVGHVKEAQEIISLTLRHDDSGAWDEPLVFRFGRFLAKAGADVSCELVIKRYLEGDTAIWTPRVLTILMHVQLRSGNISFAESYFAMAKQKGCFSADDAKKIQEKIHSFLP
jgi:hypothetical protein